MGSTCVTTKKKKEVDYDEPTSLTLVNTFTLKKKLDVEIRLLLQLIELIDIHRRYSNFLLNQLNELIVLRAKTLWMMKNYSQKVKLCLTQCLEIITSLKGNAEFEKYFPILSVSLFEQSEILSKYIQISSNCSTKTNSLNEFKNIGSEI